MELLSRNQRDEAPQRDADVDETDVSAPPRSIGLHGCMRLPTHLGATPLDIAKARSSGDGGAP